MPPRSELGLRGEAYARAYFEGLGFEVLAQNWYCRYGELDLVLRQQETIHFIEVKTRRSTRFGALEETISSLKIAKISHAIDSWLLLNPQYRQRYQLDAFLISVLNNQLTGTWVQGIG